jgi:hypothetical protein
MHFICTPFGWRQVLRILTHMGAEGWPSQPGWSTHRPWALNRLDQGPGSSCVLLHARAGLITAAPRELLSILGSCCPLRGLRSPAEAPLQCRQPTGAATATQVGTLPQRAVAAPLPVEPAVQGAGAPRPLALSTHQAAAPRQPPHLPCSQGLPTCQPPTCRSCRPATSRQTGPPQQAPRAAACCLPTQPPGAVPAAGWATATAARTAARTIRPPAPG